MHPVPPSSHPPLCCNFLNPPSIKMKTLWFLLFVFPALLLTAQSRNVSGFQIGCSNFTNPNQEYAEALNATFSILNTASSTAYFSNATSGSGTGSQAYAAYLCRYDIPLATCQECVRNCTAASSWPTCTYGEASYGLCTLHYGNRPISFRLDYTYFSYWCLDPMPNGPFLEKPAVEVAAAGLIDRATANASRNYYFATGEQADEANHTMYGMVQCAPDINATECRHCLNGTLQNVFIGCSSFDGVPAGIYGYTESCSVTYSLYAFYKTSSNSSITPQPLTNRLLPASSSPTLAPHIFITTAVLIVFFFGFY